MNEWMNEWMNHHIQRDVTDVTVVAVKNLVLSVLLLSVSWSVSILWYCLHYGWSSGQCFGCQLVFAIYKWHRWVFLWYRCTRMKLFADDVKLYCSFDKFSYDLQIVCDKLTEWANKRDEKDRVDSFSLALTRMFSNLLILTTSSQHIERCIIVRQLSVRHWTTFICLLTMVNVQY